MRGTCNCCLVDGVVRSMMECSSTGELYTSLLQQCYGFDVMVTDIGDHKRVICAKCVGRLNEALLFRSQVEESFRVLQEAAAREAEDNALAPCKVKEGNINDDLDNVNEHEDNTLAPCKIEEGIINDDLDNVDEHEFNTPVPFKLEEDSSNDDFDSDDKIALIKIGLNKETSTDHELIRPTGIALRKAEVKARIRKRKRKRKTVKPPSSEDIQAVLNGGLFPFQGCEKINYRCIICRRRFVDFRGIKEHMAGHSESAKVDAFRKVLSASANAQFDVHSSKLRCKLCTNHLEHYSELKKHRVNCHSDRQLPYKLDKDQLDCPVCHEKFVHNFTLKNHMNKHYPNYMCESCGKAFASKPRLRSHVRSHDIGVYPCKHCDMVFDRLSRRTYHVSSEHKVGHRYGCPRCGEPQPTYFMRLKHLAEVHDEELRRYQCKQCPARYITTGHLSAHVRRDHLNERNHKCGKCELAFYTRHNLNMHMIKHDGERVHRCEVCSKSYLRAKTLKEHMRIHTNDKRYVCPICGRGFTQNSTMKCHLKVHERKGEVAGSEGCAGSLYGSQGHMA